MLEDGVVGGVEVAALRAAAADDVVRAPAACVDVLQVVVVARQVQLHAVPFQQRLHVLCGGAQGSAHQGLLVRQFNALHTY